jgi:hypothetical protein
MAVDGQEGAEIAVRERRRKQAIGDGLAYVRGRYDNFGLSTDDIQREVADIFCAEA